MNAVPLCFQMTALASLLVFAPLHVSAQTAGRASAGTAPRTAVSSSKLAKGVAQPGQAVKMPALVDGKVDFKLLRGSKYPMLMVEVPVRAVQNAKLLEDATAVVPNPDWVDKIKVTVTLAFENKRLAKAAKAGMDSAKDKFIFYRASSTILTMQRNDLGTVNFYLPGELLKRDNINTAQPYAYVVDIEVDGVPADPSKAAISQLLQSSPADMEAFREMATGAVSETAGMLMTQLQAGPFVQQPKHPVTLIRDDSTRL